jgi:hypothetical protein
MKKVVCIFLAVIMLVAAGFWILISTNPDLAAELGLASGPGKPAEIISMNDAIANAPSITGIVKDTGEKAILIENDQGEYWVSLNVENKDSMTSFRIGDEVVVYFDGMVAESYPMQINTVYAITLKTPADRAENEKP